MTIAVVLKIPGGTAETASRFGQLIREELGDKQVPDGQVLYLAGPSHDGWCMVEVWESAEALGRWRMGGLANAAARADFRQAAPEVTAFDVTTLVLGEKPPG